MEIKLFVLAFDPFLDIGDQFPGPKSLFLSFPSYLKPFIYYPHSFLLPYIGGDLFSLRSFKWKTPYRRRIRALNAYNSY